MKLIAHRGNTQGISKKENYPNYIPLQKEDFFIDAINRGLGIGGDLY
jgi:hypothetical protein